VTGIDRRTLLSVSPAIAAKAEGKKRVQDANAHARAGGGCGMSHGCFAF